jgi:hypothetical protein
MPADLISVRAVAAHAVHDGDLFDRHSGLDRGEPVVTGVSGDLPGRPGCAGPVVSTAPGVWSRRRERQQLSPHRRSDDQAGVMLSCLGGVAGWPFK